MSRRLRRRFGRSKRARKRESIGRTRITIHNANPSKTWPHNYIFAFGAYGNKYVRAWGSSLDDAFDEAIDWLAEHAPGLLMDEQVEEAYKSAIAEGKSEEEAQQEAEMDMSRGGNSGHYVASWEWTIVAEDPTHEQVLQIQGRR